VFHQQLIFSYTGLGHINSQGKGVDIWLGEVLWGVKSKPLSDVISTVALKASEAFKLLMIPNRMKRHTFVAVGWVHLANSENFRPIVYTISNYQEQSGNRLPVAQEEFWVTYKILNETKPFLFDDIGLPIGGKNKAQIMRLLRNCIKRNLGPIPITQILGGAIRSIAERTEYVGKNLLIVSIPKNSFSPLRTELSRSFFINGLPRKDVPTFFYVPMDANECIQYGPVIVDENGISTDFSAKYGEWVKSEIEVTQLSSLPITVVLSERVGSGSFSDPRRPAIVDAYKLISSCDITGASSWPANEECPYYGIVITIQADENTINEIKDDGRYFIVSDECNGPDTIPDKEWVSKLQLWLSTRGVPVTQSKGFTENFSELFRREIIEKLIQFMRKKKFD
jgi:hypothetical protein